MVGYAWIANRPEKDRVERPKLVEPVFGHHAAGFRVGFAAPVEFPPFQRESVTPGCHFKDCDPFRHDLAPDTITGNDRNTIVFRHSICLRSKKIPAQMSLPLTR